MHADLVLLTTRVTIPPRYVLRSGEIAWDSVRCMIVCHKMQTIVHALRFLLEAESAGDVAIVKIVDRFRNLCHGGWADVSVYVAHPFLCSLSWR